jgi:enoyl-CoA hydratase/carnithine racemase
MPKSPSFIRLSTVRHVGWLEFNRPPVNAFTREMVDEVHDGIAALLADPEVRVLVLASAIEGYLSAGADLNVFKGMTPDGMRAWAASRRHGYSTYANRASASRLGRKKTATPL